MDTTVEQRLRVLEDRAQIIELRATYCFLVDDLKMDELVDQHFTEDAVCDFRAVRGGGTLAFLSRGRTEVRTFFAQVVPAILQDMCHMTHNHRMTIAGDDAWGDCYFEVTARHDGVPVSGAGRYIDRYRRVDGRWRFAQRNAEIYYMALLGEQVVQHAFVPLPEPGSSA